MEPRGRPIFEEEQGFSGWMKAISLVGVIAVGVPAVLMWLVRPRLVPLALIFTALTAVFLFLAVANLALRLVTTVDPGYLRLRLVPLALPVPFLPPRSRDLPLGDIVDAEVRTYHALTDRRYWGRHFWGLVSASHGTRLLYVMMAGPARARGVQLRLRNGDEVFVGSRRPDELAEAISRGERGVP